MRERTPEAYFTEQYARSPDPWGFDTRAYERRKYQLTLASLPRERYERAFEPGCANGALTELLAKRCDQLIASEPVPEAMNRARLRVPSASVRRFAIPDQWPEGTFDLVVLSEVLYYLGDADLERTFAHLDRTLRPGAHVIAVHWRGETDYPRSGDQVHALLEARWPRLVWYREDAFALDVFEAAP